MDTINMKLSDCYLKQPKLYLQKIYLYEYISKEEKFKMLEIFVSICLEYVTKVKVNSKDLFISDSIHTTKQTVEMIHVAKEIKGLTS